jgi:hypothetical protein
MDTESKNIQKYKQNKRKSLNNHDKIVKNIYMKLIIQKY